MIPTLAKQAYQIQTVETPSETFGLDWTAQRVSGRLDGLEALRQSVYALLQVERFQHVIYSWDYGVETLDLYGKPVALVIPELKRRLREALMADDRVADVDGFEFSQGKGSLRASFTVRSIYGTVNAEYEVAI